MQDRYLEYNEPSDGPQCRLQLEFEPDGHAVVLLNDSNAADFLRGLNIRGKFSDFSVSDVRCLKLDLGLATTPFVQSEYPLSSYVLATDGKSLLVPLADIKQADWAVAGLIITGKQFLRRPICRSFLLPKSTKTQFVKDQYGDSWNDNFFKEPRIVEHIPATAFTAVESIMAIAKDLFIGKDYATALRKYKKAFHYAHSFFPEDLEPADLDALTNFKINSLLNMALCNIKLQKYSEVIKNVDYALEIPGISILQQAKAFFRKGVALQKLNDEDEALVLLRMAQGRNPDAAINLEIDRCLDLKRKRQEQHREKLRGAFS